MSNNLDKVSIKFRAGAYGAYRSMNNKVWYALAEFVDNALQSYLAKKKIIKAQDKNYQFTVYLDINIDEDYIRIRDNAAGIDYTNFKRAFEPANIPIDNTGLSEFGMGMKIASIWLADNYKVRSSAIGEAIEREVTFVLQDVIKAEKEELKVKNQIFDKDSHFTEVFLKNLSHNAPKKVGAQIGRIRNHLTSIYRKFLRSNEMRLVFNGEDLEYDEPEILVSSFIDDPTGKPVEWKKEINFKFGNFHVSGFIGLLKQMKSKHRGLSLFRRGRVIQGSHDEKYHPSIICGQLGSPRFKRIFGELELKGFKVSFDKGKFTQVDELEELLGYVKKELNNPNFNLLKQGDKYRKPIKKEDKDEILIDAIKEEKQKSFNEEYKTKRNENFKKIELKPQELPENQVNVKNKFDNVQEIFDWQGNTFYLDIEFIHEKGFSIYSLHKTKNGLYNWKGRINLSHEYFDNEDIINTQSIGPIIKLFKGLLFAEIFSTIQGTKNAGYIRINLGTILKSI